MATLQEKLAKLGDLGGFDFLGVDAASGRDVYRYEYTDTAEVLRRERAGEPIHYDLTASGPVVWNCTCPDFARKKARGDGEQCKHCEALWEALRPAPRPAAVETLAGRRRQYRESWDAYVKAA